MRGQTFNPRDEVDLKAPGLNLCHFSTVWDDEGVHAQAVGQLRTRIEFDQSLKNLRIYPFGRLVGADVLWAKLLAHTHHSSPELLLPECVGGDIGLLSGAHFADVGFVDIHTHAQSRPVTDC